ncbi:metallophosphoesterase family protein [Echinicola marina]|uniref:purple acid phosphatase family protein n=1 Tax=Echinicola marina TaxID=2859768 RepID=UPI001CF70548|nr:metallophosphoesterase family protein [Echinicola marina]UCS92124.1 metallophosphoesterase family protein [Echinicola marina]
MKKSANKSRRKFINGLGKAAIFGVATPASASFELSKNEAIRTENYSAPYLQNLKEDGVSIMFITQENSLSWVQYGEESCDKKAFTKIDGFIQANNRLNKVQLKGLKPNTNYQYRVVSKPLIKFEPYDQQFGEEIQGEVYHFSTPAATGEAVSCIILNDIHDRPYSFGELLGLNKDFHYDFVALNGDMFDYQSDEQQLIDHLIRPCTSLFASEKPFIMIRGNHETRGRYARQFKDYFDYEGNEYYFSFRQGPVHFIVLDSGEDKEDDHEAYHGMVDFDAFREQQAAWLENELENSAYSTCKYKVVLMHIPPYHSGDWHGTTHCREVFSPIFEKHRIDMVISGHTHRYGIHKANAEHNYPIIIGGGPKTGSRTLIQLDANLERLYIKMLNDQGEVVGENVVKG